MPIPLTRIPRPSTCCISSTTGQIAVSVGGAAGSFGDESSGLRAGVMRSTQAISSTGIEAIVLIGGPIVHSVPHPTKLVSMQRREVVTSASRANDEPSGSTPPAGSSGQGANGGQGSSGGAPGPSTSGNSAQGQSPGSSGGNSGQPRDTVFRSFVIVNSQEDGEASVTIRNQNEYVSGTVRTIIRKVISMSASVVSRNYGTQASTSGIRPTPRTASVRGTVEPYEQRQFPSTHHSFTRTSQVAHSSSTLPSSSRDNVALSTGLPSYTTIGAGMIVAARPTESSAQHVVALGNSESTSFSTIDALFSMNRAEQPSESFRTVMDSSNNAPNLSLQANVPTYTTAFYQGQVENTRRIANETFSRTMADHRSAAVSGAMLFGSHALDNTRQSRELAEFVVHREETAASVASFRATANGGPSCSDDEEEEEEEMREFERKSNCMSDSERSSSASTPSSLERSRNSTREPSPVADREDGEEDSRISELDDIPAVNESEDDHPSSFSRDTEPFGLEYDNLRPSIPRLPRNDSFDGEIVPSLSSNIENGLESIKQQATSTQEVQTPAATPFSSGFLPGQPAQMYYQQAGTSNGYAAVPQHPYAMMNQPQYQANGPSAVSPSVPVPSNSLPPEQAQNMTTPSNGAVLNVTPRSSQQNVSSATAVASANNSPLAQPNQHHAPPSQFYSQGFPPYMQMGYPDSQRTLMMHQQQQMHMQAVAAQRFAQSNGFMQHQQFAQSQQNQQNWQGNVYDSYSDQVIIGQPGIDFGRNIYGDSARSAQNSALADPVAASEPPPPVPAKGRGRRATQNRNETGKPGRGRRKNQNDTEKRAAESIAVTPGTSSQMNAESYGVTAVECQQRRVALERGGTSSRALQNYPQTPALSQAMEAAVPRVQFHKQFSQQTYMQHPPQVYPNAQNDALRMPPPSFAPPRHPLNHGVMQSRGYPHNGQHNGSSVMPRPFMDASYFESARGQHEGTIVQMSSASTPESVRMNHSQTPTGGLTPPSSMNGRPSSGASPSNLNDVIAQQKSAQQAANHMPPRAPSVRARYPMMHPDHPQRLPMVMPFGVPSRAPYPNSFNGHPHQMEQNPPYFGQTEHPQFYPHPQIPHSQYQRNMMSVGNGYLQPHAPPQQINPTTSPSTSMTGYPANPNSFAAPEQVFQQSPNPVHPSSDIRQRQFEQQNRENVNTQPSGVGSDFAANGDQSRLSYTVSNSTLAAETGTSEHSENCWRTASRATHPSPVESNPAANTQAREDFRFFDQSKSLQSPLESAAPRLGPFADAYKPTNLPLPTPPLAENQNRLGASMQ
ncbi:hypothetical protein L596_004081 [Steinernema carpocapsae]|uniref:Uncharacterized protein n=2 Tax=Steinernema carpocapsae TaxID=34508 RepID=A0A4U8UW77_STECR|nr:hypothetical protein L596_004081 [Steinernema carpocapsae]